jgi:hypothetical protein
LSTSSAAVATFVVANLPIVVVFLVLRPVVVDVGRLKSETGGCERENVMFLYSSPERGNLFLVITKKR